LGLNLSHGLPHLFRAVIEGICFGSKTVLDGEMANAGFSVNEMTVGGGGYLIETFGCRFTPDTTGLPINVPEGERGPRLWVRPFSRQ